LGIAEEYRHHTSNSLLQMAGKSKKWQTRKGDSNFTSSCATLKCSDCDSSLLYFLGSSSDDPMILSNFVLTKAAACHDSLPTHAYNSAFEISFFTHLAAARKRPRCAITRKLSHACKRECVVDDGIGED
jgi:hypothetical protein